MELLQSYPKPSNFFKWISFPLTHWGRVTQIYIVNLTIIGSDNGLSPGRRQAIIWTNAVILLIGPLGTNFSEILIGIQTFSFKKMHLKMSSAKWRPFCLGLNVFSWWLNQKKQNFYIQFVYCITCLIDMEYHSYRRKNPLTIRRTLTPKIKLSLYWNKLHVSMEVSMYWLCFVLVRLKRSPLSGLTV